MAGKTWNRLAIGGVAVVALLAAGTPEAFADATISTAGPLTSVFISSDLNCAVTYLGDTSPEFYGTTACGTFVSVGGTLYGPASIPAGGSATGSAGYTAFTAVSQTPVGGTGTSADPFTVTTVVGLGASGIVLTEVDTYVAGQDTYETTASLAAPGATAPISALMYHAADCYLQNSDNGRGEIQNGTAPICKAQAGATNPNRIEGFYPLTAGSTYIEDYYDTVWAAIGAQTPFPNTCTCGSEIDNGAGVSWPVTIPVGGSSAVSLLTIFSPIGATPLTLSLAADASPVAPSAADGYTLTISNSGAVPQTLASITSTLPAGFTYTAGSSTGAATADPTVAGQQLTWTGTFTVPAATESGPGLLTLHYGVTVSATPGTYTSSVTGSGEGVTIIDATDVAPVVVAGAIVTPTPPAPEAITPVALVTTDQLAVTGSGETGQHLLVGTSLVLLGAGLVLAGTSRTRRQGAHQG